MILTVTAAHVTHHHMDLLGSVGLVGAVFLVGLGTWQVHGGE